MSLLEGGKMGGLVVLLYRRGSAGGDVRVWTSGCSGSMKAYTHRPSFGECDAKHAAILTYLSDVG
jgi:hypothetical protein